MKPIMSVKEARKLLGKEHENLSDDEVAELIEQLHELAKLSLDMAREQRLKKTLGKSAPKNQVFIRRSTYNGGKGRLPPYQQALYTVPLGGIQ